jgi:uncharacterized protein (DUF302 family)
MTTISEHGYATSVETRLGVDEAIERTVEALADEGFGVLSRIDVAATLKAKLGVERDPYVILGACNPQFAHGALESEPLLGVLLPCNVVVHVEDGATRVTAVSAQVMLGVVDNPALGPVAADVDARLARVLAAVAAPGAGDATGMS